MGIIEFVLRALCEFTLKQLDKENNKKKKNGGNGDPAAATAPTAATAATATVTAPTTGQHWPFVFVGIVGIVGFASARYLFKAKPEAPQSPAKEVPAKEVYHIHYEYRRRRRRRNSPRPQAGINRYGPLVPLGMSPSTLQYRPPDFGVGPADEEQHLKELIAPSLSESLEEK